MCFVICIFFRDFFSLEWFIVISFTLDSFHLCSYYGDLLDYSICCWLCSLFAIKLWHVFCVLYLVQWKALVLSRFFVDRDVVGCLRGMGAIGSTE